MLTLATPVVILASTSAAASVSSVIAHASTIVTSVIPTPLVVHVASCLLLAIISLVAEIFAAFFHDNADQLSKTSVVLLLSLISQVNFRLPKVHLNWFLVQPELS